MNAQALDAAIDEQVKLAALRESMVRQCYLRPSDLQKRYGFKTVETVYRKPIPATRLAGSNLTFYHPEDVLACEQRERIMPRVTREHLGALEGADDPVLADLYDVLSRIVE